MVYIKTTPWTRTGRSIAIEKAVAGIYEMYCLPLRIVGSDGAPARVVLRKS